MACHCKHSNEHSGSIKCRSSLGWLNNSVSPSPKKRLHLKYQCEYFLQGVNLCDLLVQCFTYSLNFFCRCLAILLQYKTRNTYMADVSCSQEFFSLWYLSNSMKKSVITAFWNDHQTAPHHVSFLFFTDSVSFSESSI